jgi:TonB-linked SusC/RagA family outer membrane protein
MTDQVLQYDFNVHDNHHVTVLGGFNYQRKTNSIISIGSQRATSDYIYTISEPSTTVINGVITTNVTNFSTALRETRSASYFGQFNYDYNAKYLIGGSIRYDGFSNFAPENKYAMFPSVSAGWNVHKENFWNVKPVSSLKLRTSWGKVGLSDLDITDTYGGYFATRYALGSGILRENLSNPNLIWESTTTTDLAFDAGFFNDRINLTVDFYNKLTTDRLADKPLPSEAPFSVIKYNNGTLQNKGVEIELGGTVVKTKSFTWRSNFSFALNRTIITKLPENGRAKNRQFGGVIADPNTKQDIEAGGFVEGERPYGLWAYQVLGVFATEAEAAAWNATKKDNLASPSGIAVKKHSGDFIFADINNDGVIDTKDQVFMGYRNPDKIGGMQNTFSYKGLSLRIAVDYALGHIISNGALARSLGQGRAFNEGAPEQAIGPDIWQKEGDVGKKYARFSFADYDFGQRNYLRGAPLGVNQSYGSDVSVMYEKGDFLAFREIAISYDLPQSIMKKIHSTGMNIFASIYNLGYVTKYQGLNPESYTGFDPGGYPRPRQFSLGATLRF